MLEIKTVSNKQDLETFIKIPGLLADGDPNWIEPLWFERRQFLSPSHNPFFKHADTAFWIATKNNKPVGRISAQIDHLCKAHKNQKIGFFGLIDAREKDVLTALLNKAEEWLAKRGVTHIRGPFSMSVNETAGLLVDGFNTPPYIMMDHHDPWLGPALEGNHYRKAKDLFAYRVSMVEGLRNKYRSIAERPFEGLEIRSLNMKNYKNEITTITSIFNDAWADNWGFIPLTEAEIDQMASELKPILDKDLVKIAEIDGEPVSFIVLLPNINEAIADLQGKLFPVGWLKLLWRLKVSGLRSGRVPLMGVKREISKTLIGKSLPLKLIYAIEKRTMERKIWEVEMSWILEDNEQVRGVIEAIGGEAYKTYRVYEKALNDGAS